LLVAGEINIGDAAGLTVMGAEVALLASLMVVAAFIDAGFTTHSSEPEVVSKLRARFWARRIADLLTVTVLLCATSAAIALAYACLGHSGLALATLVSFGASLAAYALDCVVVLRGLRRKVGPSQG
jgi:hypothetical protein